MVVTLGLGRETPTLTLGGTWIAGDMPADVGEGLKVEARRTGDLVELTLAGAMDYNVDGRPGAAPSVAACIPTASATASSSSTTSGGKAEPARSW